jgi:AcrR family transcriptional regulator
MATSTLTADDSALAGDIRMRIVEAAAELIAAGGRDAATTRAVSAAAAVQAPTIYRLFGDKRGLLDAVAEHGLEAYIAQKSARPPHPDPVEDLRAGWDMHVAFGLANPGLFAIMSGEADARPLSPAAAAGRELLRRLIRSIAIAGRLRVSEQRAMLLVQSVCLGTVLSILSQPEHERDPSQSETAREVVMRAIVGDAGLLANAGLRGAAITLRASLDQTSVLTVGESHLLRELLDRIADDV